ncbi:hypothetical protein ACFWXI_06695 [[Kitasatospora] papulosa]|uniref:hypothetical protein n=1 Tax=[Kitasatospora] papulosa TaxID=1464011 RepID=UPI003674304E
MTDQPYTADDLRTEATRQHRARTEQSPTRTVLEQMLDAIVPSTVVQDGDTGLTWDEALDCDEFEEPVEAVVDLIHGAADLSAWAVQLGADGLQPEDHTLSVDADGRTLVRLHCAFHPDLDDDARASFVAGLARVLADGL